MQLWLLIKSDKVTDKVSDKVESKSERIDHAFVIVDDIPEFDISPMILELIGRLDSLRESCRGVASRRMESRLRRTSRLRSINSSLAIEGNGLDILRMRDVINGRTVEGPFDEILETKNAIRAYDEVRDVHSTRSSRRRTPYGPTTRSGTPTSGPWTTSCAYTEP